MILNALVALDQQNHGKLQELTNDLKIGKYMQLSNIAWVLDWNDSLKNFISHRVKISSISNPGWCLEVVLDGTDLLAKPFESIKTDTSEHDWVHCYVKNEIFYGVGGPGNFSEILHIFCLWATDNKYLLETSQPLHKIEYDFLWMQNWYHSQCDGEWEYSCILCMQTLDFPGWSIDIDVDETSLAARKFPSISIHESSSQWIDCWKEDSPSKFKGRCSSNKVLEVLAIFHRWAKEFRMLRDISY
ncbi:MAG: Imm53 family immunity protein [Chlamydiales bacterium]|nr:Imm53 family immunity protein [Chlamydiales bacterium]